MIKLNLFIFIEILSLFLCQLCGINPPESSDYCGNYLQLNSSHRCCYCRNEKTDKFYCLLVINNSTIPGYFCDCDDVHENDDLPGAPCYNHNLTISGEVEITKEYCHKNSLDKMHPCCYYDDGENPATCFSIGKITSTSLYTYNDFLDCISNYQKINIFLLFYILIFIL